jgi:parvulin-like peptidyl-prolyl isomerase
MNGYVQNKSVVWTHAMKRAIGPGQKVQLDELYEQYGKKHSLAKGKDFVNWLRTVKLSNRELWRVVYGEEVNQEEEKEKEIEKEQEAKKIDLEKGAVPIKEMTVQDVVLLSVRRAREVLPKIMDKKLLTYALQEAGPLAGKDSLCRTLRKRISELDLAR